MMFKGTSDNMLNFLVFILGRIFKKETIKEMVEEYNKLYPEKKITIESE